MNVHPLWAAARPVLDSMGNVIGSNTCAQSGCHSPVDMAAAPMVPAGQLDLTDGPSDDEPDQFKSYRELLFADNRQILSAGALVDEQVQVGIDAMGNPILANVSVGPYMSSAGANFGQSVRFFDCFEGQNGVCATTPHGGKLSLHELRLVAEWLDIGAQYYNNPFDVPVM
jgi:hypothetical protein